MPKSWLRCSTNMSHSSKESGSSSTSRRSRAVSLPLACCALIRRTPPPARGVYSDPIMQKFLELVKETVFGALWTRPGLDTKTRALICVISDTCMGREPELALHLRMALRQGWTEEELTEVLLHLSGYIGV